ncbi:MAG TPA: PIN domain-containing protein [Thermoanaerobaculia bacterium]|nr:PIN domain-containing protein [Thermoanaerobaculia bacterium]
MILLDTSGVIAALSSRQRDHEAAAAALRAAKPPLLLSPFVLAEIDYLLVKLAGVDAAAGFLDEVSRRAYELAPFDHDDARRAAEIVRGHRDLAIGLAAASIVVLAERSGARDLLTLDERHFRVLRPGPRRTFRILPADR